MVSKPFTKTPRSRQYSNTFDMYAKDMTAPVSFNPSFIQVHQVSSPLGAPTQPSAAQQQATCTNCGHEHPRLYNSSSANCFFITIRRSGRDRLPLSTPHSVTVPIQSPRTATSQQDHHQLRNFIWTEFESLKAEVDLDRDTISQHRGPRSPSKGQLKEKAPLPWLSWSSPTGQSGQTRNKANFFAIWDKIIMGRPATLDGEVLVSSVLLPSSLDLESLGVGEVSIPSDVYELSVGSDDAPVPGHQRRQNVADSRWTQGRRIAV